MFLSLVFVNLVKSVAAAGSQGPRFLIWLLFILDRIIFSF